MTGLFLFIFTIIVVFFIVQIGAIAFELTGMTWQQAKFQALSCFTGTGFTTRESELVTRNPQRRKVASVIMILGHAGDLSLIATFVNYLRTIFEEDTIHYLPFTGIVVPIALWQIGKLIILLIILYYVHKYFFKSMFWKKIAVGIKKKLKKGKLVSNATFEEMTLGDSNFGVLRLVIKENDEYVNKTILESRFKNLTGSQILTIERNYKMIPNPAPDTVLLEGDILYCFGKKKGFKTVR
jgi:hypothetical protein